MLRKNFLLSWNVCFSALFLLKCFAPWAHAFVLLGGWTFEHPRQSYEVNYLSGIRRSSFYFLQRCAWILGTHLNFRSNSNVHTEHFLVSKHSVQASKRFLLYWNLFRQRKEKQLFGFYNVWEYPITGCWRRRRHLHCAKLRHPRYQETRSTRHQICNYLGKGRPKGRVNASHYSTTPMMMTTKKQYYNIKERRQDMFYRVATAAASNHTTSAIV